MESYGRLYLERIDNMSKEQLKLIAQIAYRRVLQGNELTEEEFGHLFEQMVEKVDEVLSDYGVKR